MHISGVGQAAFHGIIWINISINFISGAVNKQCITCWLLLFLRILIKNSNFWYILIVYMVEPIFAYNWIDLDKPGHMNDT